MYKRKIFVTASILLLTTAFLFAVSLIPSAEAQPKFVLAGGWDYPDAYGQGIYSYVVYSNATGSWVEYDTWIWDDTFSGPDGPIPWNASQAIKIRLVCTMNKTLVGVEDPAIGQNYIRHRVVVTDFLDEEVFSVQNFTYEQETHDFELYPHLYWYYYYVIFDFLPITAEVYTCDFVYEVYY